MTDQQILGFVTITHAVWYWSNTVIVIVLAFVVTAGGLRLIRFGARMLREAGEDLIAVYICWQDKRTLTIVQAGEAKLRLRSLNLRMSDDRKDVLDYLDKTIEGVSYEKKHDEV